MVYISRPRGKYQEKEKTKRETLEWEIYRDSRDKDRERKVREKEGEGENGHK